ncbi:hypothetical protein EBU71_04055 [bacterium]|nr:hypothetical protein [Candidatus Elulimicrobium humile]
MANIFYNRIIRKLVIGFGNIFNDITLVRYLPDFSEAERFIVPIVYGPKELYVYRTEEDPILNKKVQVTLPRMSFEMTGFTYDAARKLNTNVKNFAQTNTGLVSQYNPVPYNFDFNLYVYVRNIEDGTQIIEHILPYFTPDYTIKLNLIPEMGIVKEVPIVLNSTSQDIDYEGVHSRETRIIIWTLNFTVKGFIFGKINDSSNGLITHSITSILNKIGPEDVILFNMNANSGIGKYQIGETVYQGFSAGTATATGKVILWENNILHLSNINGNFVSNIPIRATSSSTNYKFTSYSPVPQRLAKIDIRPEPANANVAFANTWTANTIITEYFSP